MDGKPWYCASTICTGTLPSKSKNYRKRKSVVEDCRQSWFPCTFEILRGKKVYERTSQSFARKAPCQSANRTPRNWSSQVEDKELDTALEEITEKWDSAEEQDITLVNNKKRTDEDRKISTEILKQACEKLGETLNRREESPDTEPKKRKQKKGGSDTLEFLREKTSVELSMRNEEENARREDWECHTRLYEQALAQQQQQQQQHNQLMTLMLGLMQKIADKYRTDRSWKKLDNLRLFLSVETSVRYQIQNFLFVVLLVHGIT